MNAVANRRGVTLVELLTVVAILGVLLVILGFSFQGWLEKYKVEDETKRLYADVMDARARAVHKKRIAFVVLEANRYRTFEDTSTAPDGNGALEPAADDVVADTTTVYTINPAMTFSFDREGLASFTGTINLVSAVSPDYDCITVRSTRIRIGRFDGANCQEK